MIHSFRAESTLSKDELIERASKISYIQICDGSTDPELLNYAAFNALKSFENKENISKNPKIEILLLVSGTNQISKAIEKVGVKDPKNITICYFGDKKNLQKVMKELKLKVKRGKKEKETEKERERVFYEKLREILKLKIER
jgi:tRNA threonylcarbamoyladenosine modification (KEOPS) complex Cgi121 subunit